MFIEVKSNLSEVIINLNQIATNFFKIKKREEHKSFTDALAVGHYRKITSLEMTR